MSAQLPVLLAEIPQLRLEQVGESRFVLRAKGRPGDSFLAGCFFVPMLVVALGLGGIVVAAWWQAQYGGLDQAIVATVVFGFMGYFAGVGAYYLLRGTLSASQDRVIEIDTSAGLVKISQGRWFSREIPLGKVTGVLRGRSGGGRSGESMEFLALQCGLPQYLLFMRPSTEYRASERQSELETVGDTFAAILGVPFSDKGDMLWVENPW